MDGLGWETARVIKGISWWDHTLAAVRESHYCVAVAFGCIIRRFQGRASLYSVVFYSRMYFCTRPSVQLLDGTSYLSWR